MKKFLRLAAVSLFFILLGFFLFLFYLVHNSLPNIKGKATLDGLIADVEIIRDTWGIPHIFAQNEEDLFFACGYVHAQERMWQMELTRRAGYGRLSEVFGKRTLERDKVLRTLGLKEAAQKDFDMLSPQIKDLLLSYSKGVNSWMNSRKFDWPPEFLILRHQPQPWRIQDSLIIKEIMALLLCSDYQSELMRAKLVKKVGPEKALQILEEGIELPSHNIEEGALPEWLTSPNFQGSNNWVLAGQRTESGKPLLANDPHLGISLPSIWFEIHLHCPSMNVTGVSLPGVPVVVIGHNEFIAWGITNSYADVQDLYIEQLNNSQDMYLDEDGWKPLLSKEEKIRIKGRKEAEIIEVFWTERGPIISPNVISSQTPLSLRWTIYEGGKTAESLYLLNKARTWEDFVEALALFDAPSQNFVYADKMGNIGYYLSGKIPRRAKEAALFPFPGWLDEGDWKGFIEEGKKPTLYNPVEGFIITANNKIISDDYPNYISIAWLAPFRAERIKELLLLQEKHSVETLKRVQNDVYSKQGELFLPYIMEINEPKGELVEALRILKNWDLRMSSGKGAALYKIFMNYLHEEVLEDELDEDFERFNDLFKNKQAGILRFFSDSLSPWFDKSETPVKETREEIVKISLKKAFKWLREKYGTPDRWDWMRINSFRFGHSLSEVSYLRFFSRGPYPIDGDDFTVRPFFTSSAKENWGASYRQLIDLSSLENSVCVLSSGESGHFLSRFYDDQIPLWLKGQYHPMLFYRKDIEAKAEGILTLKASEQK